jgi:hypothetical protein
MLALAIVLAGVSSAAPEPEYPSLFADSVLRGSDGEAVPSLIEIESSTGRADRLTLAGQPRLLSVEVFRRENADRPLTFASASPDVDAAITSSASAGGDNGLGTEVSLDELCNALFTSAQTNDLPIPFFANLIWQESRLRADDVSRKGAQGIAQFMPQTAVEKGLDNPFDPLKAIPASARFLRELRMQFGNLGFVAAAYNAGARRVAEWLEHRGNLPRETRTYVVRVTGLSIEAWRGMPVDNDALTFARLLPCRSLPAFANVEQTQWEDAQLEDAKADRGGRNAPPTDETPAARHTPPHDAAHGPARPHERQERQAHQERKDHHEALRAGHDRHTAKREAEHHPHGAHEKRKSA